MRTALWSELWTSALRDRLHRRIGSQWWEHVPHASVTVAVCTRDRPAHIATCLAALARLDPPPDRILIVDNAPRLPCRAAVEAHGFDYVLEPRPGLDNARNRAIEQCQTELIAFTDDDCVPVPAWLERLDRHFSDLSTGAVTGWANALRLDSEAQIAFEDTGGFTRGFQLRRFDWGTLHPTAAGVTGAGANMTFRTELLRELGGFPPELDAGTPTASGGDLYVLGRVLASGARVVFDPASLVWHDHRADVAELRRVLRGYGLGIGATASRALIVDGEIRALSTYAWPFQNLYRVLRGSLRSGGSDLAVLAAAEQARGALAAPYRWRRALRDVRGTSRPTVRRSPEHAVAQPTPTSRSRRVREPEVSVVVPTVAGREAILARCIDRLGRQTLDRGRYEIIVVPNGRAPRSRRRPRRRSDPGGRRARRGPSEERGCGGGARPRARLPRRRHPPRVRRAWLRTSLASERAPASCSDPPTRRGRCGRSPSRRTRAGGSITTRASIGPAIASPSSTASPAISGSTASCSTPSAGSTPRSPPTVARTGSSASACWSAGRISRRPPRPSRSTTMRRRSGASWGTRRGEGYGDVLLAARHPIVVADLRLERFSDGRLSGRRWPLVVTVGRAMTNQPTSAAVRALGALERSNLRRGWSVAFGRLLTAAYCAGVQAALDDGHRIPRGARARTLIDVDSDAPIEFTSALGEITLVVGGQEIGYVVAPDGQWDEDEIVERAIDALGLPALAAEARRPRR